MSSRQARCIFGCVTFGVSMHGFPKKTKYPALFEAWVSVIPINIAHKDPENVPKSLKVCDYHFKPEHRTRGHGITKTAIPCLYLEGVPKVITDLDTEHNYCLPRMKLAVSSTNVEMATMASSAVTQNTGKSHCPTATAELSEASLTFSYPSTSTSLRSTSTPGAQDTYKSKWFAYDDFDFMADKNEPGTTRDTLEHVESDTTEGELEVNTTVSENENSNITSDTQPERANHHTDQSREQNDQNAQSSVQTTNKRTKKRKKTTSNNADDISDETLSEAFQLLQQCAQPPQPETDSYIAFGQYISTELRKYDAVTLVNVKNAICQIIFQADTGRYGDSNYGYYTNSYPGTPIASTSSQSQSLQPQNYPAPIPQTSPSAHLASNSSQSQFLKPQDYSLPQSPPN